MDNPYVLKQFRALLHEYAKLISQHSELKYDFYIEKKNGDVFYCVISKSNMQCLVKLYSVKIAIKKKRHDVNISQIVQDYGSIKNLFTHSTLRLMEMEKKIFEESSNVKLFRQNFPHYIADRIFQCIDKEKKIISKLSIEYAIQNTPTPTERKVHKI